MIASKLIQTNSSNVTEDIFALLHSPVFMAAIIGAIVSLLTFFLLAKREMRKINKENLVSTKIVSYNQFIDTCTEYNFYKQLEAECGEKLITEELRIKLQKEIFKIHLYGKKKLVDSTWKIYEYLAPTGGLTATTQFSDVICEFVALARKDLDLDEGAFNKDIYSDLTIREVRDCCGLRRPQPEVIPPSSEVSSSSQEVVPLSSEVVPPSSNVIPRS